MATFDKVKAQASRAAKRGPNPDDRMQGTMDIPGPARFGGTVSASKGPVSGGKGPQCFYILQKPISTQKGEPAKEAG
jgi:hypothetical protein